MPFAARNARYLRISGHTVLALYIYLDDKHVEWMTDYTLQRVLEDLRPLIGPKLRAESSTGGSNAKKGTVNVHRGDTYQFAYFFRKNEPHAVLIKDRNFVHPPSTQISKTSVVEPAQVTRPARPKGAGGKSKTSSTKSTQMRPKSKKRTRAADCDVDELIAENRDCATSESARDGTTRRSLRKRNLMAGVYHETDGDGDGDGDDIMVDLDHNGSTEADQDVTTDQNVQGDTIVPVPVPRLSPVFDVDMEGEEEKPKLIMQVTYQGFTIYDRCLCLIIEPWSGPPLARGSDNPTEWHERTPMVSIRERTPLFLPELDPRRSSTPAPLPSKYFPPVPLFDDGDSTDPEDQEDATDDSGMMAFSQVLKSAGGERAGSADEDDNEGDVFLGDADERRGIL